MRSPPAAFVNEDTSPRNLPFVTGKHQMSDHDRRHDRSSEVTPISPRLCRPRTSVSTTSYFHFKSPSKGAGSRRQAPRQDTSKGRQGTVLDFARDEAKREARCERVLRKGDQARPRTSVGQSQQDPEVDQTSRTRP